MKTTKRVTAPPGARFPLEGAPRRYITDAKPVEVQASPYYLRALADGDLVEVK